MTLQIGDWVEPKNLNEFAISHYENGPIQITSLHENHLHFGCHQPRCNPAHHILDLWQKVTYVPESISAEERAVLDAAKLCVESNAVPGSINYTILGTAMHKAYYKKPTVRSVIKETVDTYANAADLPVFIESRLRSAGFLNE